MTWSYASLEIRCDLSSRWGIYLTGPLKMPGRSARPRWLNGALALAATAAMPPVPATAPRTHAAAASDFLDKYCLACHNSRLKTAGLQLDSLSSNDVARDAQTWEKIVTKLRTGEMPPPGR